MQTAQRDLGSPGSISRGDVAAVCVSALSNPKAENVTFEVSGDKSASPAPGDLEHLFDDLQPGVYE